MITNLIFCSEAYFNKRATFAKNKFVDFLSNFLKTFEQLFAKCRALEKKRTVKIKV